MNQVEMLLKLVTELAESNKMLLNALFGLKPEVKAPEPLPKEKVIVQAQSVSSPAIPRDNSDTEEARFERENKRQMLMSARNQVIAKLQQMAADGVNEDLITMKQGELNALDHHLAILG